MGRHRTGAPPRTSQNSAPGLPAVMLISRKRYGTPVVRVIGSRRPPLSTGAYSALSPMMKTRSRSGFQGVQSIVDDDDDPIAVGLPGRTRIEHDQRPVQAVRLLVDVVDVGVVDEGPGPGRRHQDLERIAGHRR